jgi:mannose-1-phosphate guanylyltransferase
MKAVILAGGFGTRLRPLSCTRPKLLFPIGNKPLLNWTLEMLKENGVTEVVLAVNYMAENFKRYYGDSFNGVKIHYSEEKMPLKTGGPIKKVEDIIGHDEPFLALNGDVLSTINYAKMTWAHRENKNAVATIALFQVEDPSRYGVVEITEKNKIIQFIEKPKGEIPGNFINAGIYVLNPEIFDYIPAGRPVSIEREIFPKLAKDGKLYGHRFTGLWIDIGLPKDYLKANQLILQHNLIKTPIDKKAVIEENVEIVRPVAVGADTFIDEKSKIGPSAIIGENVIIGKGVQIENSVIFPNTTISEFSSIKNAIIGEGAIIGRWVKIEGECIIGDHAFINDGITLVRGVTVCPSKEVTESVLSPASLM